MEYKNILLIKMSSLGDILHSLPFADALRRRYPKAKITWLVHPQFAGFLPDPPVIDEVIYFDKVKFNKMGLCDKLHYFREMCALLHSRFILLPQLDSVNNRMYFIIIGKAVT